MRRLIDFIRILNHPCREMTGHISRALDDDQLPWSIRFAYKLHLTYCSACRRYRKQLLAIRHALRNLGTDPQRLADVPGPQLSPAARARIAKSLESRH